MRSSRTLFKLAKSPLSELVVNPVDGNGATGGATKEKSAKEFFGAVGGATLMEEKAFPPPPGEGAVGVLQGREGTRSLARHIYHGERG